MKPAVILVALVACSQPKPVDTKTTIGNGSGSSSGVCSTCEIHRFKIGALDAVALKDGGFDLPNDGKVIGVGQSAEEISAVLTKAGAPTDHLELSIQPLLVNDGAHVLLFDTGLGSMDPSRPGMLLKSLVLAGVAPTAITDIFISHSHGDHVGGLVDASGALAFPNATIHMSEPEWQSMQANDKLKPIVTAITPKVAAFAPGATLLPEVTAIATPGHTPGHSSYDISSGSEHLFYLGDLAHHWVISVQKPTWGVAFDKDPAAQAMRQSTLAKLAADKTRVYAVHFPFPGLGHVVGEGDNLSWQRE